MKLVGAIGKAAFWVPPRIWAYACESQPDGDFSKYDAESLAMAIGYDGDASVMLKALIETGFMDEDKRIHDWEEYNGFHKKYSDRGRKAANKRWNGEKSTASPNNFEKDKEKDRGDRVSNAQALPEQCSSITPRILKLSERISMEKELERVIKELDSLGHFSNYDRTSKEFARIIQLKSRQRDLKKELGVVA